MRKPQKTQLLQISLGSKLLQCFVYTPFLWWEVGVETGKISEHGYSMPVFLIPYKNSFGSFFSVFQEDSLLNYLAVPNNDFNSLLKKKKKHVNCDR